MPPSATAAAQPAIDRIRTALTPVAHSAHPTEPALRAALLGLGFEGQYVQTSGLAYGVETDGGCVDGLVSPGRVTAAYEGFIADGGCMVMYGH